MGTTRCALIFLVSACLWGMSCTSSIILCTDSPTRFENGTTIPAMLGKPVSVVFCVQCQPRLTISKYMNIIHPNHNTDTSVYYTNNRHMWRQLIVNITSSANKATVNITIKAVQKEDFIDQFSVTINTNKSAGDNSVFVFQLSEAEISDPTPSDAFPILTTQPKMPAISRPASSSTMLSTVPSPASTAPTSTISPTQEITECWPNKPSQCPENWYQVDTETCLLVIRTHYKTAPSAECKKHDSKPVNIRNITKLRRCLTKILEEAKAAFNKYIVRVNNTYYFNVQSRKETAATETYSVVCANRTFDFSPPSVSTRPTDHPVKPVSGSTSMIPQTTRVSTLSTQATTDFPIPATSTQAMSQCLRDTSSTCPQNWYQVDNDTCLIVVSASSYSYSPPPSSICRYHYGIPVLSAYSNKFTECLKHILEQSVPGPISYVLRVDTYEYVNIQSGAKTSSYSHGKYHVACYQMTEFFKPPTVSSFSLKIVTKTGWQVNDNGTDHVTVQTAYEYVALTCHAEGTPTPRVIITDESQQQFTSGTWVRLNVCRRAVFTCTANNTVGSSQAHRRILLLRPFHVTQFSIKNKNNRQTIRPGVTVELRCVVEGCPDNITITRNAHPIAETANYTSNLVHEIHKVNCSHMGTYTCLAKSPTGQGDQKTASLEVRGCPVSLCQDEDTSREISPILGENITFSLCLMSSERLKYSANETKIIVTLTRNRITSFYWTVNITMYSIEVKDYTTHTVRIGNSDGSLDVYFTLRDEDSTHTLVGQKAQQHETDSNVLIIALPPVCYIILVFIIAGIVWYRVKGKLISRIRSEDIIDCGSSNDNSGEGSRQVLEEFPEAHAPENPHYEEIINFRSDMPGSRKVLEELPEAQAPENPHYEETVDFRSDMPVMYANLRETSVGRMPEQQEAEQQQGAGRLQRQEDFTTTDLQNKKSVRFTTGDGTIYFNVVT